MAKKNIVVMAIPDLQEPFAHPDAMAFLLEVRKAYKPTHFVNMGDEVDFHALSDWDADPDGFSAGHELDQAIEAMQKHYKAFPEMMVCKSNHTDRPFRKAKKMGMPAKLLKSTRDFLEAPKGWEWADTWEVDGVLYEHGIGFSGKDGAIKAAMQNMQPTVIGHIHAFAGIQYYANEKHLIYGFNVGCLIDRKAYAFEYGKHYKAKPILGAGIINNGIPVFVPMVLNGRGRWRGYL